MDNNSDVKKQDAIEIHIDGRGARPGGHGSGFAWTSPKTGKFGVDWKDGLTNNQAEYHALLAAVTWLSRRSTAVILSDSQVLCEQFNRRYQVRDATLGDLLNQVRNLIREKSLYIEVRWIPRSSNLADKLLIRNISDKTAFPERRENHSNVTLEEP